MSSPHYDIIIVGAGIVGMTLARALRHLPYRIAIIESRTIEPLAEHDDTRSIGLTHATQVVFDHYDLWAGLQASAYPLRHLHISNQGHFGMLRLAAQDHGLDAFGYMIPMHTLYNHLVTNIKTQANLTLYCPQTITHLEHQDHVVKIHCNDKMPLQTQLLVAADGTHSWIRDQLKIKTTCHDYQQTAFIANAQFSKANRDTAFERFLTNGPMAVLPRGGHNCGVIWTIDNNDSDKVQAMSKGMLIDNLQKTFGYRLGYLVNLGQHQLYPLRSLQAKSIIANRTVLVGNAANTLHPVAAQGFNLGVRDVATLVQHLSRQPQGIDLGNNILLQNFAKERASDHEQTFNLTDSLVRIFSNQHLPWVIARNLGLLGLSGSPACQQSLVQRLLQRPFVRQFERNHETSL